MMALAGIELETLVSEPDALTTRPPENSCFINTSALDTNEAMMRPYISNCRRA